MQREVHARVAPDGVAGYKIGCTSEVMQRYLNIDSPCVGGVRRVDLHHGHGTFRHAQFVRVGVECELAVRLDNPLPARADRYERDLVAAAVGAVMCAIEVVDDRWHDYREIDTPSLIADDFFAAGCVLGEPLSDWRSLDLGAVRGAMLVNGERVGEGHGRDILGDPLSALEWLVNAGDLHGHSLKEGHVVLLGSMVRTQWLAPGDQVRVEAEGLGGASALFA